MCPGTVAPDHPDSYYSVARRMAAEMPGGWQPDQYANPENPASHYASTGPEIWAQTDGTVTHFVAGIGTGGTITGAGRYLKDASGGAVRVIGADPEGSVYSGGSGRPYLVEGVGEDIWPATYDPSVCDEIIRSPTAESFGMTRRLAREEALLAGGSSGLAVAAALRVAAAAGPGAVIVVLLPDSGRGYLSKIFNDEWMADYGFLVRADLGAARRDVLARKERGLPELVHVHPEESVAAAIALLREYGVSQLPVVRAGAAGDGGRGHWFGGRARSARGLTEPGRATCTIRSGTHVRPAADCRLRRAGVPCGPGAWRTRERPSCTSDGKPSSCSPARTCWASWRAACGERPAHRSRHADHRARRTGTASRPSPSTPARTRGPLTGPSWPRSTSLHLQAGRRGPARGGYEYARSANPTRTALETCLAALEQGTVGAGLRVGAGVRGRPARTVASRATTCSSRRRLRRHLPAVAQVLADGGSPRRGRRVRPAAVRTALHGPHQCRSGPRPRPTRCSASSTSRRLGPGGARGRRPARGRQHLRLARTCSSRCAWAPTSVVHSTTKYLGGHSDVVGGALVVADPELAGRLAFHPQRDRRRTRPFRRWLRCGAQDPGVRMDRHCDNAERVVELLARLRARSRKVLYPGLATHRRPRVGAGQMRRFGGMVAFRLLAGVEPRRSRLCEPDPAVHPGGVARRRRVPDRASGPDDARLGRRLGPGGPARPGQALGRHRGLSTTCSTTCAGRWGKTGAVKPSARVPARGRGR